MAHVRCPQCNTVVEKPATGDPVCPTCGFGAAPASATPARKTAAKKTAKSAAEPAPPPPPPPTAPPAWVPSPSAPVMSPPAFSDPGAPVPVTSGKAVAAMVVGIVSCCLPFIIPVIGAFVAVVGGIVALVLGIVANKEIDRDPARFKGKGMAITGIVLGSIMIALGILMVLAFFVFWEAFEEAVCEEDPNSEECEAVRDFAVQDDRDRGAWVGGAATSQSTGASPRRASA